MGILKGKVALVTGASHPQGIGCGIARKLAEAGASVIVADLSGAEGLDSIVAELELSGVKALAVSLDVTDVDAWQSVIAEVNNRFGKIDILVNNAGVGGGEGDFLKLAQKQWDLSIGVNLLGVANGCQAVIPSMINQGGGAIINTSSLAGLGAIKGISANYTATKFAVIGLTKQLAVNYAANNIRINAVCPGSIITQMHSRVMSYLTELHDCTLEEAQEIENSSIPMGHSAQPDVVGDTVVFLASDSANYITGISLPVAGGMSPGL